MDATSETTYFSETDLHSEVSEQNRSMLFKCHFIHICLYPHSSCSKLYCKVIKTVSFIIKIRLQPILNRESFCETREVIYNVIIWHSLAKVLKFLQEIVSFNSLHRLINSLCNVHIGWNIPAGNYRIRDLWPTSMKTPLNNSEITNSGAESVVING